MAARVRWIDEQTYLRSASTSALKACRTDSASGSARGVSSVLTPLLLPTYAVSMLPFAIPPAKSDSRLPEYFMYSSCFDH